MLNYFLLLFLFNIGGSCLTFCGLACFFKGFVEYLRSQYCLLGLCIVCRGSVLSLMNVFATFLAHATCTQNRLDWNWVRWCSVWEAFFFRSAQKGHRIQKSETQYCTDLVNKWQYSSHTPSSICQQMALFCMRMSSFSEAPTFMFSCRVCICAFLAGMRSTSAMRS